ncbi:MAG TPA: hypothetical protein VHD76_08065 [Bryobacteraceae bacterium]|jgi:hypothetical protein|nr:hypothetical protein [Bryobacteraceae bacterium]
MIPALAVLLLIGAVVLTLFVRWKDLPEPEPVSPTAHLEERKARIYENLRDLQFEYRLGKLSDEDYQKTKQDLQKELARVLGEIDAAAPAKTVKLAPAATAPDPKVCPHCGAKFDKPLKFCGECGKTMRVRG